MDWINSLIWCIIGAFISLLISLFFYLKSKTKKQLIRTLNTVCLISEKTSHIDGLEIKHDSSPIENLYSSTIQIKNIGNSIINNTDIPKSCPLTINTNGKFILDKNNIQLPAINNENNIHIEFDNEVNNHYSTAKINFEYIDQNQLITFTLLHTGDISFGKWIIKGGNVFESKEPLDSPITQQHYSSFSILKISNLISIITAISVIVLYFMQTITHLNDIDNELDYMYNNSQNTENYINNLEAQINYLHETIYDLEINITALEAIINSKEQENTTTNVLIQ